MWAAITNLGDAALTLPIALGVALWVGASNWRMAVRWLLLLGAGMVLVGATKILYAGCGIEVDAIQFRVISGHTMLASAIWPVGIALLTGSFDVRKARWGAIAGLTIGALIGVARIFDNSHTVYEVLAGWVIGTLIALFFVQAFFRERLQRRSPILIGGGLLLVSGIAFGHHAPLQMMIEQYSPTVCAPFL